MTSPQPRLAPAAQGRTLSKATPRAASLLGLAQAELAPILGSATISRMAAGDHVLAPGQKSWELAALFVRLFRSLDALVGLNAQARAWLDSENAALGGAPRQLIRQDGRAGPRRLRTWTLRAVVSRRPAPPSGCGAPSKRSTSHRRRLVDDLEEQRPLEEILDATKPAIPPARATCTTCSSRPSDTTRPTRRASGRDRPGRVLRRGKRAHGVRRAGLLALAVRVRQQGSDASTWRRRHCSKSAPEPRR